MDSKEQTPSPFSLRLSFEERAQLERDAAGLSLGAYVRERIFDGSKVTPRRRGKFPVKDQKALASVLAMLGQSRLANNLNQLAHAANTGSLAMTPDTEAALKGELPLRGRPPTHDVYAEDTNRDGTDRRRKIGVGFVHLDGGGLSLIVDCVPLTGQICIRERHFSKKELH